VIENLTQQKGAPPPPKRKSRKTIYNYDFKGSLRPISPNRWGKTDFIARGEKEFRKSAICDLSKKYRENPPRKEARKSRKRKEWAFWGSDRDLPCPSSRGVL